MKKAITILTHILAIIAFLPLSGGRGIHAAEPTLTRLSFWVSPERIAEFEAVYQAKVAPILKHYAWEEAEKKSRASTDSIFTTMFAFEDVSTVINARQTIENDPEWKQLTAELGTAFGTFSPDDLIKWMLSIKKTPSGPGNQVVAGTGQGHWTTYSTLEGLAGGNVTSLLQDRDGYLWIGTSGTGLTRYDGETFKTFTTEDGLVHGGIWSIFQDRDGYLWFGTNGGVSRYDGETFKNFTTQDGLANNNVSSILQDRDGALWFGTPGSVSRYDGQTFSTFTRQDGLVRNAARSIIQDREGSVWFGTRRGVSRYDGQTFTTLDGLANNNVHSIIQDRDDALWFGTMGGVSRYDGQTFTTFTTQDGLAGNYLRSIFQDRDGALWFGTYGRGVSRYDGQTFTTFTTQDGLPHDSVNSVVEDRDGALWFGTDGGGMSRYDGQIFTTFTAQNGLWTSFTGPMFRDRDDALWFGVLGEGVSRYDGETFTTFTTQDGLARSVIFSIYQDREGNLWFGTDTGGVSRYDGQTFSTFSIPDGLASNGVYTIYQDREGNLWFGTEGGVSRYDGGVFSTFTTQDGLAHNTVRSILQDRDGALWFGTYGGGVSRYDGQNFTTFTVQDGLAHNNVRTILQDREGKLWFGTYGGGVSRYDGQTFITITIQDGLAHNSVRSIFQDRDGALWFSTDGGGVTRYRQPPQSPPPVFIDAVIADRRYEDISDIAFPSTVALTMFEFHGISFKTRRDAMVYRYRLKGYEKDWQTTRDRRVEYENLPRGTYTFEVEAVDRDLVYSDTPATVALAVHLPYERVGLYSALGVALVLIGWQSVRIIRRDRRLQETNEALSSANHELFEKSRTLEVQNIQLTEAREAADAANQAKSRFLASMSHELRTPLNGILGYAQILNRGKNLDDKQHNGVNIIRRSGEHLLGLINEVLDLARIEADRVELEDKEIRLSAFLKNIVAINEVRAKEKTLTFSHLFHPDLPETIIGDPKRLRQVLDNLLSNAIKFTHQGEVSFCVAPASTDRARVRLCFEIQDSGVGLSKKESVAVFRPFEQAGDTAQKAQGTGLGLAISQQIVGLMGGEIQVKSELGKGSCFFFEADFSEVESKGETVSQEERLPISFEGETKRVLVVDDTEENRSVLLDLLEPLGFEIEEAENGEEALKLAADIRPDLILMDLVMPELDGFQATRQIRQSDVLKDVVVIGLSASVFEEDKDQSINAGCDDFVAKPFQASELLAKVGELLKLKWIYEVRESQADDNAPLVAPPSEALNALYDFAQKGQILGLKEEVDKLAGMGDEFGSFVSEVKEMVGGFQLDELCDFIKPHLERVDR